MSSFYQNITSSVKPGKGLPCHEAYMTFHEMERASRLKLLKLPKTHNSPFSTTLHSDYGKWKDTDILKTMCDTIQSMKDTQDVIKVVYLLKEYGTPGLFEVKNRASFDKDVECLYLNSALPQFQHTSSTTLKKWCSWGNIKYPKWSIRKWEEDLVKHTTSCLESLSVHDTYNRFHASEWMSNHLGWMRWFWENSPVAVKEIVLDKSLYFQELGHRFKSELEYWKVYLTLLWVKHTGKWCIDSKEDCCLPCDEKDSEQLRKVFQCSKAWWQDAGIQYVNEYKNLQQRDYLETLCNHLRTVLKSRMSESSWTSKTKDAAMEKLMEMQFMMGWNHNLAIKPTSLHIANANDSFANNMLQGYYFQWHRFLHMQGNAIDFSIWREHGFHDVTAYYIQETNTVVIPLGFMQAPFWLNTYQKRQLPKLYATIGTVVSHEIMHAFDAEGRWVDPYGKLRKWWDPEDERKYNHSMGQLVKVYGKKGRLSLSENIADYIGLELSWKGFSLIWHEYHGVFPERNISRKFFEEYAKSRVEVLDAKSIPIEDPHLSMQERVDIPLQTFIPFLQTYNLPIVHSRVHFF